MCSDRRSLYLPQLIALGVSIAFATGASAQTYGPYRAVPSNPPGSSTTSQPSSPSYRPAPSLQPAQAQPLQPQRTSQPAPAAAPASAPAPAEAPRRAQAPVSAQAAAACMNERRSLKPDVAIKSCDAVIDETLKNLANGYYFRGVAKADKNDYDGAIGDYTQALKVDPQDPDYLNSRAQAYEAKNDLDKALADYNQSLKVNPKSIYAYNNRGAAYQRKGDYARAAADYGEVTKLQPNNIDAWSARCWVRAMSPGQAQQALSDCDQALKIKADVPDVLDTRGFVNLKLNQFDNAIKDYDAALKGDPKLAGSLYGRGLAKLRKGDRHGGSADINAAKQIKSDIAEEFARYGLKP
jgi:tetratricopeptide (TPR) repeat protein